MDDSIEHCQLCGSLCRRRRGKDGECYYAPFIESVGPDAKEKMIAMLREARFCASRLEMAIESLRVVTEFLQSKGHKIMYLQVKETLRQVTDGKD